MFRFKLEKLFANENIDNGDDGCIRLTNSFFIINLYEDNEHIIGVIKNNLIWDFIDTDGEYYEPYERDDKTPFNYGDNIIYNKETKKIDLYDIYEDKSI